MCPHFVVENFLPDPDAYRAKALSLEYYTIKGPDGALYKNISVRPTGEHKELIEAALGKKIEQDYSFIRFSLYGEPTNSLIHADSGYSEYALVLYLSPDALIPPGSGTGFYQHKKLKYDKVPELHEIKAAGKSPKRVWETLEASWNDPSLWNETGRLDMKFNRAIIYPSKWFHARLPHDSFGMDFQNARMIFGSFFSV